MILGSIYLPNFFFQVEVREDPSLSERALVIGLPSPPRQVIDMSPKAERCGIRSSMPLREAQSLCPDLLHIPFEKARYEEVFESLLESLSTLSPSLEGIPFSFLLIDLTHEREKEGFMRRALGLIRKRHSLKTYAGIASNRFVARLASMLSEDLIVVPEGREGEFLKDLPVDYLPCDEGMKGRLKLFGMRKMEDIRKIPPSPFLLQFGKEAKELPSLARGIDGSWINPWKAKKEDKREVYFEEHLDRIDELLLWAERLIESLLTERVCFPTRVTFLFQTRWGSFKKTFFLREEAYSKETILFKLRSFLEEKGMEGPVKGMTVLFSDYERREGTKMDLFGGWVQGGGLLSAIREIERRYGRGRVRHEALETAHLC